MGPFLHEDSFPMEMLIDDMSDEDEENEGPSALKPFQEALNSFLQGIRRTGEFVQDRWQQLSFGKKILLWIPLQAVLFKIQPLLWQILEYGIDLSVGALAALSGDVASLNTQTQLILILIGLFSIQTTVLSVRLIRVEHQLGMIGSEVEDVGHRTEKMITDVNDALEEMTDGGIPTDSSDTDSPGQGTTGTGAIGGAIAGGAIGASIGGPAGALGGAFLGLILGDELEKESIRQEQKEDLKASIVRDLIENGYVVPTYATIETVQRWKPMAERELLEEVILEMNRDPEVPIELRKSHLDEGTIEQGDGIAVSNASAGWEYVQSGR